MARGNGSNGKTAKNGNGKGAKEKKAPNAEVENYRHDAAKRRMIPTAEQQGFVPDDDAQPKKLKYPRNADLDPQLVWRGKDQENESDLYVDAPPVYIQEKIHPRQIIERLKAETKTRRAEAADQPDLFADFNGRPTDLEARTEFYAHDQNWSNRMILGDALLVMASLAERENLRGKVQCIYMDPPLWDQVQFELADLDRIARRARRPARSNFA
jgi:adenine-specific DNA-methyltransferase